MIIIIRVRIFKLSIYLNFKFSDKFSLNKHIAMKSIHTPLRIMYRKTLESKIV